MSGQTISRVVDPITGELCLPYETPNFIYKFFAEIGSNLAEAIPMASDPEVLNYDFPIGPPIDYMSPELIAKYLSRLDRNKSSGCPIVITRLYLDVLPHQTEHIAFIFKLSL